MTSPLLEVDEIIMRRKWMGSLIRTWWPLLDSDGRRVGRAMSGHVRDADDVLIVRPGRFRLRRPETVLTGDGSLVGTLTVARTEKRRRRHDSFQLRLGDSEQVVAEYTDGTVRLTGAEGREVATIVGYGATPLWHLTFSHATTLGCA